MASSTRRRRRRGAPSDHPPVPIERDVADAALRSGMCFDAGESATFRSRFGVKIGPAAGVPIDATVTVTALRRDCWQSFGPTRVSIARRSGSATFRTRALGLELFRDLGIEPLERKLLVAMSTNHFMAAFGSIAAKVIHADADGPLSRDHRNIPYTRVQRPIRPLDAQTAPGLIT
jgi:microcystin degradation protein MlrC